jgi:Leucine-rich repeat (LRR) protein
LGDLLSLSTLRLYGNQLSGEIPTELGNLSNLTMLSLFNNQLSGTIPSVLGNLTNLTHLYLHDNQLSGNIPPELGDLTNLTTLYLSGNQLSGAIPQELGNLLNLDSMSLSDNHLTGSLPPELGDLINLTGLYLYNNQLSGSIPYEIGDMINIVNLYLDNNRLSGDIPTSFINLINLGAGGYSLGIGYNMLTATDPVLIEFLNEKDTDWAQTQTVPPMDVSVGNISSHSIELFWTPILYTADGGYYEVGYATSAGGPYAVHGTTNDKSAISYLVDGLSPQTDYYFVVRTYTPSHGDQQNDLLSEYGQEVSAATSTARFCDSVSEIPTLECEALESLYNSTNGDNWTNNDGWLVTYTPCSTPWFGVTCSGGHITEVELVNNQLIGNIPGELGDLGQLQTLVLGSNQLNGSIPTELGSLNNLINLGLYDNQLNSSIPTEFEYLVNLVWLNLSDNQLGSSIPIEIGSMSSLERLLLYNNQLSGEIPGQLGTLINLTELRLNNNQLGGDIPASLTNLVNLISSYDNTDFGYNMLTASDPDLIGFLVEKDPDWDETQTIPPENVQVVSVTSSSVELSWNPIFYNWDGGYYEVGYATAVGGPYTVHGHTVDKTISSYLVDGLSPQTDYYFVVRTYTPSHGDQQNDLLSEYGQEVSATTSTARFCDSVSEIPTLECEALESLYNSTHGDIWTNNDGWLVTYTPCSTPWFGVTCSGGHVTELDLRLNQLTGSIPPELGELSSLLELNLSNNEISGSIPPELGNLSSLHTLWLSNNQLTGGIPPELGGLSSLWYLFLEHNQLTGNIPPELGNLSGVQFLFLSTNQLSGSIPPEISNLSNLSGLALSYNQLTGSIPPEIGNLSSLRQLSLSHNQLNGSIPPELGNLSSLQDLYLNNNQLTGNIPAELGNLSSLEELRLYYNQLNGSIPPELGSLSSLLFLHLNSNQLSGNIPLEIANLTSLVELNIGYNMLTASDPDLIVFLDEKDPAWADTQTIPPADLQVVDVTSSSATLTWTPITYTGDGGYYEVSYATIAGGPYSVHGTTTNKTNSSYLADNLSPGTTYYFVVRTFTPPHDSQQNELWSEYSQEVYTVTVNTPPVFSGLPDIIIDETTDLPVLIDLWTHAEDAETPDSGLTYTIEGEPPSGAGVTIVDNRWLEINPSFSSCVNTDIALRVTDPGGLWDEDIIHVDATWICLGVQP